MDDIIIETEPKKEYNNRIFIFHDENSNIKEKIEVLSITKEQENENIKKRLEVQHIVYLNNYLDKRYLDDKNLQYYKDKAKDNFTLIYLLTAIQNDLIITDTTTSKYEEKNMIVFVPNSITEYQINNLKKNEEYIKNYNIMLIIGMHLDEYNMITENEVISINKDSFNEMISKLESLVILNNKKK